MQSTYGPYDWTPPDAGNADHSTYLTNKKFALSTLGGGDANNDSRYVRGYSPYNKEQTSGWGKPILEYLAGISKQEKFNRKPFCLFYLSCKTHMMFGFTQLDIAKVGIDYKISRIWV